MVPRRNVERESTLKHSEEWGQSLDNLKKIQNSVLTHVERLGRWHSLSPMLSFVYANWMARETTLELSCNLWMNLGGTIVQHGPSYVPLQYWTAFLTCLKKQILMRLWNQDFTFTLISVESEWIDHNSCHTLKTQKWSIYQGPTLNAYKLTVLSIPVMNSVHLSTILMTSQFCWPFAG